MAASGIAVIRQRRRIELVPRIGEGSPFLISLATWSR
jgi:hypothetical protein